MASPGERCRRVRSRTMTAAGKNGAPEHVRRPVTAYCPCRKERPSFFRPVISSASAAGLRSASLMLPDAVVIAKLVKVLILIPVAVTKLVACSFG